MQAKDHWEKVYSEKAADEVSWFQPHAETSLQLIRRCGNGRTDAIIDVGGGASTLVDDLLAGGYANLTVLDVSSAALRVAQDRLGAQSSSVQWLEADITMALLPSHRYAVWHDRAVFHFLTGADDRRNYVESVRRSVRPGGHVIIATFAPDGPLRCSGLETVRYSPDSLLGEFGDTLELVDQRSEMHQTPFGTEQHFIYCCCRII
jgi:SAM-dependent methyltransferase